MDAFIRLIFDHRGFGGYRPRSVMLCLFAVGAARDRTAFASGGSVLSS